MNEKFVAWALKVHTDHPELVQQWKNSPDITERALATGIQQAIENGNRKKGNTTRPTASRTDGQGGAFYEEKASHFLCIANSSSVYINKPMQFPEVFS